MSVPNQELNTRLGLRDMTERRRRLRRRLTIVATMIAVALVTGTLLFSPVLATHQVEVRGTAVLSTEEVIEAAQVPLGVPLTRLPRAAISERISALAPVADVRFGQSLPHTLIITVTERTMVYQVADRGSFHWVDGEGVDFHQTAEQADGLLGVLDISNERLLRDVATVVTSLGPEVVTMTTKVTADSIDHIVLTLSDGRQINWGSAEKSAEKAAVLPTLLGMKAAWIDVSVPSHPAIK